MISRRRNRSSISHLLDEEIELRIVLGRLEAILPGETAITELIFMWGHTPLESFQTEVPQGIDVNILLLPDLLHRVG
jgi:hypothetical protein